MEISPTQVSYRSSDMHGFDAELTTYRFFMSINPEGTMTFFTIPIMLVIWIFGVLGFSASLRERFVTHFHIQPRVLEKTSEVGVYLIWLDILLSVVSGGTIIRVIS